MQDSLNWSIVTKKWNYFLIVQSNNQCKWTFKASWSRSVAVNILRTGKTTKYEKFCNHCHVEHPHFCFKVFFPGYSTSQVSTVSFKSVQCRAYGEQSDNKMTEKQQGPTLRVHLWVVYVMRVITRTKGRSLVRGSGGIFPKKIFKFGGYFQHLSWDMCPKNWPSISKWQTINCKSI